MVISDHVSIKTVMEKHIYGVRPDPHKTGHCHYVYRITHTKTNQHYYGKRSCRGSPLDDLGVVYFSSALDEKFKQDQQNNPSNYNYKVVRIFDTPELAMDFERFLHQKFDVGFNDKFLNRIISGGRLGYDATNMVVAKTKTGETVTLDKRLFELDDTLLGIRAGLVTLRRGNERINVKVSDKAQYLMDGWSTYMTGKTAYRDNTGNVVMTTKATAKERGYCGINIGLVPVIDSQGNKFSLHKGHPDIGVTCFPIVGRPKYTSYKTKDGVVVKAHVNDERVLSGELVGISKGFIWWNNGKINKCASPDMRPGDDFVKGKMQQKRKIK